MLSDQRAGALAEAEGGRDDTPPNATVFHHPLRKPIGIALGLFLAGVIFAAGHHIFNAGRDGDPVASSDEGRLAALHHGRFRQADALKVGNLLATLAENFLAAAVGLAVVQRAWRTMRRHPMTINGADSLFSLTYDPMAFTALEVWKIAFFSVILSAVVYAFPLVTVFAPSSLTTRQVPLTTLDTSLVPSFNASHQTTKFWTTSSIGAHTYNGPVVSVRRMASAMILGGEPASTSSPCQNCTYTQVVHAPAFNCSEGHPSNITIDFPTDRWWSSTTFGISPWTGRDATVCTGDCNTFNGHLAVSYRSNDSVLNATCYLSNGTYTISSDYTYNPPNVTVLNISLGTQWPFYPEESTAASDLSVANMTPNVVGSLNFEAIKDSIYVHLNGTVGSYASTTYDLQLSPVGLDFIQSYLIASPDEIIWVSDVPRALEELTTNMTLSLLSRGFQLGSNETLPVQLVTGSQTIFQYSRSELWIPYAVAIAIALVCLFDGFVALLANAAEGKIGFKAFLKTTRDIAAEDLGGSAGKTRVRYGPVGGPGGREGFSVVEAGEEDFELRRLTSHS